jgi:hypothetical protein
VFQAVSSLYTVDGRTINECGAVGGMRIGRGNRNTRRKPVPIVHCNSACDGSCVQGLGLAPSDTKKEVKLSLCLTIQALRHEGVWGSGCIDPRILDPITSWG